MKKEYSKDKPHPDIGKSKYRVRQQYVTWVEYDVVANSKEEAQEAVLEQGGIDKVEYQEGYHNDNPVEVYAQDWNTDYSAELYETNKIAECVPYEDSDSIDYGDYNWVQTIMSGSKKKKQPKSRVSKVYLADDGTVIDAKDWKWLQEKRIGTPQSVWLRGYRKWKRGQDKP